jgi:hypothetical protein
LSGRLVRLLVATVLTVLVLWQASPSAVLRAGARASPWWIAIAILLVVADRTLLAYRWIVLVRVLESAERLPLAVILRVFFVSTFVGTFLPTSIGTDAVRVYSLARVIPHASTSSLASVLMDRFLGVLSLLIVTGAGLVVAGDLLRESSIPPAVAATAAACSLGIAAIYSARIAAAADRLSARLPLAALQRAGHELVNATRAYARRHGAVANVLLGSIVVQLLRIAQAYALGRALAIPLPIIPYFVFVPIILLVMLLPISIGGLGTSQVAFVTLFGRAAVPAGEAVALSLLFLGLGLLGNLPGALLYMSGRNSGPRKAVG